MFSGKSGEEAEAWELEQFASTGAVLMGRTMLDVGIGPWGENPTFHAPVFVVTHRPAETVVKAGGTSYMFATDGPDAALRLARATAGERDIYVAGGAAILGHYLHAGVIDELSLAWSRSCSARRPVSSPVRRTTRSGSPSSMARATLRVWRISGPAGGRIGVAAMSVEVPGTSR